MRVSTLFQYVIAVLFLIVGHLLSQEIKGGTAKYQHISKNNYQSLFAGFEGASAKDWVASIPTESKRLVSLNFLEKSALYEKYVEAQVLPKRLKDAQAKATFMQGPGSELKNLYYDFEKNEIVRHVDFMTRDFLVFDEIEPKPWKLTNKMSKILDYTCFGAELLQDGQKIFAYFTAEIPFSIGPEEYYGLPGLILAVEINGETAFLAQSINLTVPDKDDVSKPTTGKKVSQEEFDKIRAEKIKEYNETKKSKRGNKRRVGK
jgi:GLPGLI family protein